MNILKSLNSEKCKGNTLISPNGDVMTKEKAVDIIQKMYKNGVKSGDIDFTIVTYKDYETEQLKGYKSIDYFIGFFPGGDDTLDEEIQETNQ